MGIILKKLRSFVQYPHKNELLKRKSRQWAGGIKRRIVGHQKYPVDYFKTQDKVYLASADQFGGMAEFLEGDDILQCEHLYMVIGGLGGLNILPKLRNLKSLTLFDINPFMIEICHLVFAIIRYAEDRDTFISLIYHRQFDSTRYTYANQQDYYALPIDPVWQKRLHEVVGDEYFKVHQRLYTPYIQDPMRDIYDGTSLHCTRMPVFHEAPAVEPMVYPHVTAEDLRNKGLSSVNSFFFGKGWLQDDSTYRCVRDILLNCPATIKEASIFDLSPPPNAGLYASNVLEPDQKQFPHVIQRFLWTIWFSVWSEYRLVDYILPKERLIPIRQRYGKYNRNPHSTCCELLDDHFDLNAQPFLEVIVPHILLGMQYGFQFYDGQSPVSVQDFLDEDFDVENIPDVIGIHILMGEGASREDWKRVVQKAFALNKTLFMFEHRKACNDWDIDRENILPEKDIDKFLLTLDTGWQKYAAANTRGKTDDPRNICWILRR